MPFKAIFLPLTASLALHALAISSFCIPLLQKDGPSSRSVEISYVQYSKETTSAPPQIHYPPVTKITHRKSETAIPDKKATVTRVGEVRATEGKPAESGSAIVSSFKVRNSEEFLADPQKGKIFLDYFGQVKQRVRRAVEQGYSRRRSGRGDVTLMFVLKADGAVVKIFPVNENSSADDSLKDFAVRCVREGAPFPRFPKELGMDRISFNLSILFDET